MKHAVYSVYPQ